MQRRKISSRMFRGIEERKRKKRTKKWKAFFARYLMQRRKKIEILSRMFRFVRRFYNERKRTKKGEALVLHCWISDIYAKKRIGDFSSNVSCNDARGMERKEENGREERWEKKNRYIWCKGEKENRGFLFRLAEGRKLK